MILSFKGHEFTMPETPPERLWLDLAVIDHGVETGHEGPELIWQVFVDIVGKTDAAFLIDVLQSGFWTSEDVGGLLNAAAVRWGLLPEEAI